MTGRRLVGRPARRGEEADNVSRHVWIVVLIVLSMFVSIFLVHPVAENASAQAAPFVINVGVQDEMKTRNLIRGFFFGTDVWTADALNPVGEGSVQSNPETQEVLPYTMVGTDVNGDGKLQASEVGVFSNVQGIPSRASEWIAFFSIKGMKWHDGTQVQLEDVLFGYHLAALAPAVTSSRFVKDRSGLAGSVFDESRRGDGRCRSEEHTSELQSPCNLVCRLLLEKKKTISEA